MELFRGFSRNSSRRSLEESIRCFSIESSRKTSLGFPLEFFQIYFPPRVSQIIPQEISPGIPTIFFQETPPRVSPEIYSGVCQRLFSRNFSINSSNNCCKDLSKHSTSDFRDNCRIFNGFLQGFLQRVFYRLPQKLLKGFFQEFLKGFLQVFLK